MSPSAAKQCNNRLIKMYQRTSPFNRAGNIQNATGGRRGAKTGHVEKDSEVDSLETEMDDYLWDYLINM
jgi:hypothetical protein